MQSRVWYAVSHAIFKFCFVRSSRVRNIVHYQCLHSILNLGECWFLSLITVKTWKSQQLLDNSLFRHIYARHWEDCGLSVSWQVDMRLVGFCLLCYDIITLLQSLASYHIVVPGPISGWVHFNVWGLPIIHSVMCVTGKRPVKKT